MVSMNSFVSHVKGPQCLVSLGGAVATGGGAPTACSEAGVRGPYHGLLDRCNPGILGITNRESMTSLNHQNCQTIRKTDYAMHKL